MNSSTVLPDLHMDIDKRCRSSTVLVNNGSYEYAICIASNTVPGTRLTEYGSSFFLKLDAELDLGFYESGSHLDPDPYSIKVFSDKI